MGDATSAVLDANRKEKPMARKHKHMRPDNPLTAGVLKDIKIKINVLLHRFKDYGNGERHDHRRHDIHTRLVGAVMRAYAKFKDNDRCSFESYAALFLKSEVKHYIRENVRIAKQESATVSCDRKIDGGDGDDDAPTFVDCFADPRDRFAEGLLSFDFDIISAMLEKENPLYARIFALRREGYKLAEIYPVLGVPDWELYDILWPAVKDAVRRIYDHGCEGLRKNPDRRQ